MRNRDRPRYRSAGINPTAMAVRSKTKTGKIIPAVCSTSGFDRCVRFEPATPPQGPQPRSKREEGRESSRETFSLLIVWFLERREGRSCRNWYLTIFLKSLLLTQFFVADLWRNSIYL